MRALRAPHARPTRILRVPHTCSMRALRVPFAYLTHASAYPSRTLRLPHAWHTRFLHVPHTCATRVPLWKPLRFLLETSRRPLEALSETSWRHLGGLLGALERPWALLASPKPIWDLLTSAFERSCSAPEDQMGSRRSPKRSPERLKSLYKVYFWISNEMLDLYTDFPIQNRIKMYCYSLLFAKEK